jgi:putative transposase
MPYARKHQLSVSFVYHVINRGNKKEKIFNGSQDYLYFTFLLRRYVGRFGLKIYHWILMPNHYHLLLEIAEPERISSCMAGLNRAYTSYHHNNYSTSGFLWQGRFKLQPVQKERYLFACGRYIERNPVRAKIVSRAQDYRFGSAKFYCLGEQDGITTEDPAFAEFGKSINVRRIAYREFLNVHNSGEEKIFRNLDIPVGDNGFTAKIMREGGRLFPKRRGRPRERIIV